MGMFRRKSQTPLLPSSPVDYPAGIFVHTEQGYFYIASPTKRYRCITERVVKSWSPRIVETTEAACAKFKVVAKLKFRNGSLLMDVTDGRVYFISEGRRRLLTSPEAWTKVGAVHGYTWPTKVSQTEILLHEEGDPIT